MKFPDSSAQFQCKKHVQLLQGSFYLNIPADDGTLFLYFALFLSWNFSAALDYVLNTVVEKKGFLSFTFS